MQFYPSYTLDSIMAMQATLFFSFLNHGYKNDARGKIEQITIAATPYMKKEEVDSIINSYRMVTGDIIELLEDDNDYSGLEKLKEVL